MKSTAAKAVDSDTQSEAAELWTEIFQHFFPLPEEEELAEAASDALVKMEFDPVVKVVATHKKNQNYRREATNSIGPIAKDCDITFTLTNANQLPPGAKVRWVVRNEGDEAELENDLGHMARGEYMTSEHSAYRGTHFMDLTIFHIGRIIGRRRIPVIITGTPMVARNLPRKRRY